MKHIQHIEIMEQTREEILPGFAPDFPYLATYVELDRYTARTVPWHWHRTVELFYLQSGVLEYTTPHGSWVFPAGSGGLVNSNVLHTSRVRSSCESAIQLVQLFDPALLSGWHGSRMERRYLLPLTTSGVELIPLFPDDPAQAAVLTQIQQALALCETDWGYEFRLREALSGIWLALVALAQPKLERNRVKHDCNETLKQMMVYLQEHMQEPLRVEQVAQAAHISKRTCFRLFQETLHLTPLDYLRSCRLQKACQLLAQSDEPMTQIAERCGLGSSSYFSQVFRAAMGCSPSEYRKHWHDFDNIKHSER